MKPRAMDCVPEERASLLSDELSDDNWDALLSDHDAEVPHSDDVLFQMEEKDNQQKSLWSRMSRRDVAILAVMCSADACFKMFYSIVMPFFPDVARKKGVTPTVTGLILGVYEIVAFVVAPFFGAVVYRTGYKFMFIFGVVLCGGCAIGFGFLEYSPPGGTFVALCLLVRGTQSLGGSAYFTATYSLLAYRWPDRVGLLYGILSMFSGAGFAVGPPVGGWLYQVGGFELPLLPGGIFLIVLGLIGLFLMEGKQGSSGPPVEGALRQFLKIPVVLLSALVLVSGTAAFGFSTVVLGMVLTQKLHSSPLDIGMVYLVSAGVFVLMSPVWGYLSDRCPSKAPYMLILGYFTGGFSFYCLGPAPFFNIKFQTWQVYLSSAFLSAGYSSMIICFKMFVVAARAAGMPDSIDTYGAVSGVFRCCFALGSFIGPVGGNFAYEKIGFEWTCVLVGTLTIVTVIFLWIYVCLYTSACRSKPARCSPPTEQMTEMPMQETKMSDDQ